MSIQKTRSLPALVLLAVFIGALFAVARKTEYDRQLKRLIPGVTMEAESETDTASAPSDPEASSEQSPLQLEGLPDENNEDKEPDNITTSTQTEQFGQDGTNTIDEEQNSDETEQGSNQEELAFELSGYAPAVRERLSRARKYYDRARTQNELVQDSSISSERRMEANSKARTNAQHALDLLQKVKEQLNKPDPDVNELMDRVQKIYRKSFRRAKMWGGY